MENPPIDNEVVQSRLSHFSTLWTTLASVHEGSTTEAAAARLAFIQRYQRAAYRSLLGALHDADAVDELFQELVLRFVQGDIRGVTPDNGRFRDSLKTMLSNLIADFHKRQSKRPVPLSSAIPVENETASVSHDIDSEFLSNWRDELFDRAWEKLEQAERAGGPPLYSVLLQRAENPDATSSDIAMEITLAQNIEPALSPDNVRKLLQRARQQFADHLLNEVARSLQQPTSDDIEQELIDLDLLRFCRGAILRRD